MAGPLRAAVFVGTRADLGPLDPVIAAFDRAEGIEISVLCGVAFGADDLADRLRPTGFSGRIRELAAPMTTFDEGAMLTQGALLTQGARDLFTAESYDALVVLGDRWELLYVVPAAMLTGVRIVHIHGGEITEGAIDERVRHAVTKLADVHCVASEDAAARIRQMGEPAERVHVTGAPGLDRLVEAEPYTDDELAEVLGRSIARPLGLFTYHPPTATADAPLDEWVRDALAASLAHCRTLIVTDPGMDEGREAILDTIEAVAQDDSRIIRVRALGPVYPRVLASVDAVIGNSSSGVIEAATVGVPAVDIGSRQAGRLRAASVVHADDGRPSVEEAVGSVISAGRRPRGEIVNPYGNGGAADRIVAASRDVMNYPFVKPFRDAGGTVQGDAG